MTLKFVKSLKSLRNQKTLAGYQKEKIGRCTINCRELMKPHRYCRIGVKMMELTMRVCNTPLKPGKNYS
jgi:hypothetical protein